ncbi:hypothetical protein L226DRAFT_523768 [Lentinus tigrinus ALCF2SS1-7]|uniref:uncharacterized protein n=1 Tax=Lentinus tigrinus ALCF2SS1-7 TaxID=1328758 RepID=UPI001165F512|nr:hypothetical protein L226DRAFT_523768 [Lentinus tigrinus ALCF2SS1-7]
MAHNCPAVYLKSITTATPLTISSSPSRVTTAAIVGAVVFGGMFLGLLFVLFYAGWAYRLGLDSTNAQRGLQFPRLGVFRAWLDPQAQMFPISLATTRDADDAELASRVRGGSVIARPARVLHEPLPPYEHPPPYVLGVVAPSISDVQSTIAGTETTPDVVAGGGPL